MPTPFQMLVAIRGKFGKDSREYQKFKEYFYQVKNQKILYRIYKNMLDK